MFPYIEQGALYNAINFRLTNRYSGSNANTSILGHPDRQLPLPLFPSSQGHHCML